MITSLQNAKIKTVVNHQNRKVRNTTGMFLVEGHHLVDEAKKHGSIVEIFTTDSTIEGTLVSRDVMHKMATTETPQSVVALVRKPLAKKVLGDRVLVLANIQDPGNAGTLIRTAVAFGFDTVIVEGVDIYAPKTVRSSQGALFHINMHSCLDVTDYFTNDYAIIGAQIGRQSIPYDTLKSSPKMMIVLGNEGSGLTDEIIKKLDSMVFIPIMFESLNVAVAGGILMNAYRIKR